jgi:hypothetical protein
VCSALVALINISVVCPLMTWCGWWTITLRVVPYDANVGVELKGVGWS